MLDDDGGSDSDDAFGRSEASVLTQHVGTPTRADRPTSAKGRAAPQVPDPPADRERRQLYVSPASTTFMDASIPPQAGGGAPGSPGSPASRRSSALRKRPSTGVSPGPGRGTSGTAGASAYASGLTNRLRQLDEDVAQMSQAIEVERRLLSSIERGAASDKESKALSSDLGVLRAKLKATQQSHREERSLVQQLQTRLFRLDASSPLRARVAPPASKTRRPLSAPKSSPGPSPKRTAEEQRELLQRRIRVLENAMESERLRIQKDVQTTRSRLDRDVAQVATLRSRYQELQSILADTADALRVDAERRYERTTPARKASPAPSTSSSSVRRPQSSTRPRSRVPPRNVPRPQSAVERVLVLDSSSDEETSTAMRPLDAGTAPDIVASLLGGPGGADSRLSGSTRAVDDAYERQRMVASSLAQVQAKPRAGETADERRARLREAKRMRRQIFDEMQAEKAEKELLTRAAARDPATAGVSSPVRASPVRPIRGIASPAPVVSPKPVMVSMGTCTALDAMGEPDSDDAAAWEKPPADAAALGSMVSAVGSHVLALGESDDDLDEHPWSSSDDEN